MLSVHAGGPAPRNSIGELSVVFGVKAHQLLPSATCATAAMRCIFSNYCYPASPRSKPKGVVGECHCLPISMPLSFAPSVLPPRQSWISDEVIVVEGDVKRLCKPLAYRRRDSLGKQPGKYCIVDIPRCSWDATSVVPRTTGSSPNQAKLASAGLRRIHMPVNQANSNSMASKNTSRGSLGPLSSQSLSLPRASRTGVTQQRSWPLRYRAESNEMSLGLCPCTEQLAHSLYPSSVGAIIFYGGFPLRIHLSPPSPSSTIHRTRKFLW